MTDAGIGLWRWWVSVLDLFASMPVALQMGWAIVALWCALQVMLLRRMRHAAPSVSDRPLSKSGRHLAARPVPPPRAAGGGPEFLAELGLHDVNRPKSKDSSYR